MNDEEFEDLLNGNVIDPKKVTTFDISLYVGDKCVMKTKKEIREEVLGRRGVIRQHCFTIKWERV